MNPVQSTLRGVPVPEAKALAALLVVWIGLGLAAIGVLEAGPARVLAPALVAVVVVFGLWRPTWYAGVLAGLVAAVAYAALLLLSAPTPAGDRMALAPALAAAAPTLILATALLLIAGLLADMLGVQTERDALHRLRDDRMIEELTPTLGDTGVMKWEHAHRALHEEIERARRYGHLLSLALIGIAEHQRAHDHADPGAGEEQLLRLAASMRKLLRATDRVALYEPGQLAVVMPHTALEPGLIAVDKVRLAMRKESGLELHAGVAEFPHDAVDVDELVKEAGYALKFALESELGVASRNLLLGG